MTPNRIPAGRGSNQYQSKPGAVSSPNRAVAAAVSGAVHDDPEEVAWAFTTEGAQWRAVGIGYAEALEYQARRIDIGLAGRWAHLGFTAEETEAWLNASFGDIEATKWRDQGFQPREARQWHDVAIIPADAAKWRSLLDTPGEVRPWVEAGVRPADYSRWVHHGFTGATAGPYARRFDPDEAAEWRGAGISAEDADELSKAGWTPTEGAVWLGVLRLSPYDDLPTAADWRHANPELAGPWIERGFSATDAAGWDDAGFSAEEADGAVDQGWDDPEFVLDLIALPENRDPES